MTRAGLAILRRHNRSGRLSVWRMQLRYGKSLDCATRGGLLHHLYLTCHLTGLLSSMALDVALGMSSRDGVFWWCTGKWPLHAHHILATWTA